MAEGFPKLQISKFLDHSRNEQIVIRCDDWDELMELKKKAESLIPQQALPQSQPDPDWVAQSGPINYQQPQPTAYQPKRRNQPGQCPKCGAPMKQSQKGNWFCSATCWLKK